MLVGCRFIAISLTADFLNFAVPERYLELVSVEMVYVLSRIGFLIFVVTAIFVVSSIFWI